MFEEQKFLGPDIKSIRLDTSRGVEILNQIELPPNLQCIKREELWIKKFGTNWITRTNPRGVYNCAGLVWASRRTSILKNSEWGKIYEHDKYRKLNNEPPQPGDLAIYTDDKVGYLHVGLVIRIEPGIVSNSELFHRIISKWNSCSGEYIHYPPDVPFKDNFPDYVLEYWTDR